MLSYYLAICSNVHKGHPDRFTYFETRAGDGVAKFKDRTDLGSALIAATNPLKFRCVLTEGTYAEELHRNIKEKIPHSSHVVVISGDSNAIVEDILNQVPAHFHSLAFLDPTHPGQLHWSTLKAIAQHKYQYSTGQERTPEILLNFPVNRIKRNAGWLDKPDRSETRKQKRIALYNNDWFFGTQAWRTLWPDSDLRKFYIDRVMQFGYEIAYSLTVEVFGTSLPIYDLILFVRQEKAREVLPGVAKHLDRWRKEDYIRDVYKIQDITKWTSHTSKGQQTLPV